MSTRSGKRIHGSFHENETKLRERKTRSKRLKENYNETVTTEIPKKRNNYVSYPASEDINENMITESGLETNVKVLKEKNPNTSLNVEKLESVKTTRHTRRARRSIGKTEDVTENKMLVDAPVNKKKSKKDRKKKSKPVSVETASKEVLVPVVRKTKKKKNKADIVSVSPNQSNGSLDSFHSAAGSPLHKELLNMSNSQNEPVRKSPRKSLKRKTERSLDCEIDAKERTIKKTKLKIRSDGSMEENNKLSFSMNSSLDQIKDKTSDKSSKDVEGIELSAAFDKETEDIQNKNLLSYSLSSSLDQVEDRTPDKSSKDVERIQLNATFDKETENGQNKNLKYATFDTTPSHSIKLNTTYEKENTTKEVDLTSESAKKSLRSSTTLNKASPMQILNSTFDKSKEFGQPTLNSTYDKETKLHVTEESKKSVSEKCSIIISNGSANLTFDKSIDSSRISITSDDSSCNNIVNTTPVLIESSIDESQMLDSSKVTNHSSQEKSLYCSSPETTKKEITIITPLKREGTFTKESSDVVAMSPKTSLSSGRTPTKQNSLPSAGCTPFHVSRSSQKEKNILNLTHSIEKSNRRSSLAEVVPRTTKVMFCSPVNNPVVVMQQKRKVIKSNLKGSNKSFVFDEVSEKSQAAPRKRSLTNNDADDARAKRKRLGDVLQISVDRLSRPRSTSATVKLSEPSTPSKKASMQKTLTESKSKTEVKGGRTKLPNFAALHQKQFDLMESLDECQQRRARRARLLLTPNSRTQPSPANKGSTATEPAKTVAELSKKTDTPKKVPRASANLTTLPKAKVTVPSIRPKVSVPATQPKLPTLESLRPGYTRFGFKMHADGNPFSVPPTQPDQIKPNEFKPNGVGNRQHTQPSLNGTTLRKEAAKQMVMREKSFTSLSDKRNLKRKENRSMIKGVRTNRRFELQMQMRNVNA